jgi:hypothetical protein
VGQALAAAQRVVRDCKRCAAANAATRFAAGRIACDNARDKAGYDAGAIDGAAG